MRLLQEKTLTFFHIFMSKYWQEKILRAAPVSASSWDLKMVHILWGYLFSTYAKISEKLTSYPLIRTRTYAYQGVRIVSFSKNVAYVLNEWFLFQCNYWWLLIHLRSFSLFIPHENIRKCLKFPVVFRVDIK